MLFMVMFTCFTVASVSVPLDIGLQRTFYPITEGQGSVEICTVVISGDISGSSIEIEYTTVNGIAKGDMTFVLERGTCITILSIQSSIH